MFMKRIVLNVAALLVTGLMSLPAAAQMELKFGHVGAPGSLFDQWANAFAKRANEKLGDKAKVVVFGSSQLGTDEQMLQKLRLGTIDFALPSTVMSTVSDVFGLFEMPYLVKDREHMKRIAESVFWPSLAPAAEQQGYKIIGLWENGFRHVHQQPPPDREARRPQGHQAAGARRQVARQDVPELRLQSQPDGVLGIVRGAPDRRHGRAGEPADPDLQLQAPGSSEIPVYDRACLHPGLCHGRRPQMGKPARRCATDPARDRRRDPGVRLRDRGAHG